MWFTRDLCKVSHSWLINLAADHFLLVFFGSFLLNLFFRPLYIFTFQRRGSNKWRDCELPKDILSWYCLSQHMLPPKWVSDYEVVVDGVTHTLEQYSEHVV